MNATAANGRSKERRFLEKESMWGPPALLQWN